jgi:c(7)-type cytochrome triheme protein
MDHRKPQSEHGRSAITRRAKIAVFAACVPLIACLMIFGFAREQDRLIPDPADTHDVSLDQLDPASDYSDYGGVSVDEAEESTVAVQGSRFNHQTVQHRRMPCLVCHVRSDSRATPKLPGHVPCSSCHVQEFSGNTAQMCTICHTATSLKPFPGLRSFNAVFDHSKHMRQTNCATCHRPASRGVALSIPARLSAHTTCFQCHTPNATSGGRNIGSCSTCHQPGRLVRTSTNARSFRMNFSHAEHTRKNLACSECHTVRPGRVRGQQVSSPQPAMHFAPARSTSCATCHNERRAFGDQNFSNCRKCHEGASFRF